MCAVLLICFAGSIKYIWYVGLLELVQKKAKMRPTFVYIKLYEGTWFQDKIRGIFNIY